MNKLSSWFNATVVDLLKQLRWSFLPPLMVYFAAGVAGLTGVVGAFFTKEYLGLSAALLASLGFWAGIPWALKMPLGHLVDVIWRWKSVLVYIGAIIIAISLGIVYGLIAHREAMTSIMSVNAWFIASVLLSPIGYVVQDVVADAMTVEAVPLVDENGNAFSEDEIKRLHVTMQTLGRIAIISGLIMVAALNISMFSDVETLSEADKLSVYGQIYLMALVIPVISVTGVTLGDVMLRRRRKALQQQGYTMAEAIRMLSGKSEATQPDYLIFGGSILFVAITLSVGLAEIPLAQEIIFVSSMLVVLFLMRRLIGKLEPAVQGQLWGTALIIFVFRAVPLPGPGATWWEIDVLQFDQQFLAVLSLITSSLALAGMLILRPLIAQKSIAYVVVLLTFVAGLLSLPNIGLYYGVHQFTAAATNGVVDAHFIAVLDTALESPLAQIAMIPMLAWIARNAPPSLKATFFAVMASFTNLALSASSLGTRYLNEFFTVSREVRDPVSGTVQTSADYSELGWLLITVAIISVLAPLLTIAWVQGSRWKTTQ